MKAVDENEAPSRVAEDASLAASSMFKYIDRNEEELETLHRELHRAMISIHSMHTDDEMVSPMQSPRTSPRPRNIYSPIKGGESRRSVEQAMRGELESEIAALNKEIAEEREQTEELKMEIDRLTDELQEQLHLRQDIETSKGDLELERDQLLQDLDSCRGELMNEREAAIQAKELHQKLEGEAVCEKKQALHELELFKRDSTHQQQLITALELEVDRWKAEANKWTEAASAERSELSIQQSALQKCRDEIDCHQGALAVLKEQTARADQLRQDLERERDQLQQDIEECRAELFNERGISSKIREDIARMQGEIDLKAQLLAAREHLADDVEQLKTELAKERESNAKLREDKARMEVEASYHSEMSDHSKRLRQEIDSIKVKSAAELNELSNLRVDLARLQTELQHKSESADQHKALHIECERLRVELENERDQLHQDLQETRIVAVGLRETNATLTAQIQAEAEHKKEIAERTGSLERELTTGRDEVQALRQEVASLREDKVRLESEILHSVKLADSEKTIRNNLETLNLRLEEKMDGTKQDLEAQRLRCQDLEKECTRLQSQIDLSSRKLFEEIEKKDRLQQIVDTKTVDLSQGTAQMQQCEQERTRLTGELSSATEQNQQLLQEQTILSEHLHEALGRGDEFQDKCAKMAKELSAAVKLNQQLERELSDQRISLAFADNLRSELVGHLNHFRGVLSEVSSEVLELYQRVEDSEARHEDEIAQYVGVAEEEAAAMEMLEADLQMSHELLDQSRQAELQDSYHARVLEEGMDDLLATLQKLGLAFDREKQVAHSDSRQEKEQLEASIKRLQLESMRKTSALMELEGELKFFRRQSADRLRHVKLFGESPDSPGTPKTPKLGKLELLEAEQMSEKIGKLQDEHSPIKSPPNPTTSPAEEPEPRTLNYVRKDHSGVARTPTRAMYARTHDVDCESE